MKSIVCSKCNGEHLITLPDGKGQPCPQCGMTGILLTEPCSKCGGEMVFFPVPDGLNGCCQHCTHRKTIKHRKVVK